MSEESKAIVRRFYEALNGRDVDALDEVIAEDLDVRAGMHVQGLDELKAKAREIFAGFPDLSVSLDEVIAEGDKVAARVTWTGTHTGEFEGIPPTGRRVENLEVYVFHVRGGKIAEFWEVYDQLTVMQQLGLMPEAEGGTEPSQ